MNLTIYLWADRVLVTSDKPLDLDVRAFLRGELSEWLQVARERVCVVLEPATLVLIEPIVEPDA